MLHVSTILLWGLVVDICEIEGFGLRDPVVYLAWLDLGSYWVTSISFITSWMPILFNLHHHPVVCMWVLIAHIQPHPLISLLVCWHKLVQVTGCVQVGYVKTQWVRVIMQTSVPKVMNIDIFVQVLYTVCTLRDAFVSPLHCIVPFCLIFLFV